MRLSRYRNIYGLPNYGLTSDSMYIGTWIFQESFICVSDFGLNRFKPIIDY